MHAIEVYYTAVVISKNSIKNLYDLILQIQGVPKMFEKNSTTMNTNLVQNVGNTECQKCNFTVFVFRE